MSARLPAPDATPADREVVSCRILPFPRERVFAAFGDPAQLPRWWGPKGFTSTIHQFDLHAGGTWRLTMHGPDGTDYSNESHFTAVERPERIVYQHLDPVHRFQMTMLFAAEGAHTRLTWRMRIESAAEFARVKDFIRAANEENFDRLASHMAELALNPQNNS